MTHPNQPQQPDSAKHPGPTTKIAGRRKLILRLVILAGLILVASIGYVRFGEYLTLDFLARQESELHQIQHERPALVYLVAFILYVVITGLSLPGAAVLTLGYGWYFGVVVGTILVSLASTTGATLAFLLSRFLARDMFQRRFGHRLAAFNKNLESEGPFYLFTLRLIPAVPFFIINLVMGLTAIKTRTFWWVSQIGMLPGTIVYVFAGSRVPTLQDLADDGIYAVLAPAQLAQITVAFVLLGVFPLIVRRLLIAVRGRSLMDSKRVD